MQDDGLHLRKAALSALDALLAAPRTAACIGPELLPILAAGARDHDDVRMLAHGAIVRAAALPHLASAFAAADGGLRVADALAEVLNKHGKAGDGGVAVDVVRSAVRALDSLLRCVPALGAHRRLAAYVAFIES